MQVEVLRRRESPEELIKGSLSNPEFFKVYALIDLMYKLDGGNISSLYLPHDR